MLIDIYKFATRPTREAAKNKSLRTADPRARCAASPWQCLSNVQMRFDSAISIRGIYLSNTPVPVGNDLYKFILCHPLFIIEKDEKQLCIQDTG